MVKKNKSNKKNKLIVEEDLIDSFTPASKEDSLFKTEEQNNPIKKVRQGITMFNRYSNKWQCYSPISIYTSSDKVKSSKCKFFMHISKDIQVEENKNGDTKYTCTPIYYFTVMYLFNGGKNTVFTPREISKTAKLGPNDMISLATFFPRLGKDFLKNKSCEDLLKTMFTFPHEKRKWTNLDEYFKINWVENILKQHRVILSLPDHSIYMYIENNAQNQPSNKQSAEDESQEQLSTARNEDNSTKSYTTDEDISSDSDRESDNEISIFNESEYNYDDITIDDCDDNLPDDNANPFNSPVADSDIIYSPVTSHDNVDDTHRVLSETNNNVHVDVGFVLNNNVETGKIHKEDNVVIAPISPIPSFTGVSERVSNKEESTPNNPIQFSNNKKSDPSQIKFTQQIFTGKRFVNEISGENLDSQVPFKKSKSNVFFSSSNILHTNITSETIIKRFGISFGPKIWYNISDN